MTTTLAKWMVAIFILTFMTTPILSYVDSLHRNIVDTTLHEYAKQASIQGAFTTDLMDEMKQELSTKYNFQADRIVLSGTTTRVYRGEYIEGSIQVPRGPIFLFDIFNNGPSTIDRSVRIRSEYVGG